MPDLIDTMAYNRTKGAPWHGKGTPANGLMTAGECIRNAQLDWGVSKVPLRLNDEGGLPLSGLSALVRTDRPVHDQTRILGIVGDEYQPLQNWDAFHFFDAVVGDGKARYETAGSIDNGKRVWLLASLGEPITPVKDDAVIPYLLLANGHDGQLMVHLKFTPVRVVCQNTLAMALHRADDLPHLALRHDRTLRRRLVTTGDLFGRVQRTLANAADLWKQMVGHKLATRNADNYFRSVFGGTPPDENAEDTDATQLRRDLEAEDAKPAKGLKADAMEDFESDENRKLRIDGTLWAAYNAAVWAIDYRRRTSRDLVDDLCLAEGARLKERAKKEAERLLIPQQSRLM
jgi:phage/plasmid-like protein (TIGR03299 family)